PPRTLESEDPKAILLALVGSPNIASRLPLFQQYDWLVQSRTVRRPEQADAAVLKLEAGNAIATSIDGNGRKVACDPYWGSVGVVLECASNLACVGAEPLGTTNNLNFGNPEKPHVAWQLTEAVRGIADACRALDAPIVGGNVSLYNEGATAGPIYPTPTIGMVGELPDAARAGRLGFESDPARPDSVALVGPFRPHLPGSELAKLRGEALPDGLPEIDVAAVRAAQEAVRAAVRAGDLTSAHDVAEGGLLVAVAECCLGGDTGVTLDLGESDDPEARLFGEAPGGFVVSGPREAIERLGEAVELEHLGTVGGDAVDVAVGGQRLRATLAELRTAHAALARLFA
ncbi:MAG: Phosphoribosylformylglycinamidine synthase, synthetase subunit, partial [uncultured Solirubrobacteraceae bacterium]